MESCVRPSVAAAQRAWPSHHADGGVAGRDGLGQARPEDCGRRVVATAATPPHHQRDRRGRRPWRRRQGGLPCPAWGGIIGVTVMHDSDCHPARAEAGEGLGRRRAGHCEERERGEGRGRGWTGHDGCARRGTRSALAQGGGAGGRVAAPSSGARPPVLPHRGRDAKR